MVAFHLSEHVFMIIMILKVAKILANVVPNYPFSPKGNYFWKVD